MQERPELVGYVVRRVRSGAHAEPAMPEIRSANTSEMASGVAEGALEGATREAERIVARADRAVKERMEALEDAAKRRHDAILTKQLLDFHRQLDRELDLAFSDIVRLVRDAVETILGSYPHEDLVCGIVRKALRSIRHDRTCVLIVSTAEAETAHLLIDRLIRGGELDSVRVEPDPELRPGQCRLELGGLRLDVGLDAQLTALEARLGIVANRTAAEPLDDVR